MMKILENVVFLGQQGLALRGDGDDETGNFYQLVLLRAKDDPALQKWIEKSYDRHMTPKAQNEILKLLTLRLLRKAFFPLGEIFRANTFFRSKFVLGMRCAVKFFSLDEYFVRTKS